MKNIFTAIKKNKQKTVVMAEQPLNYAKVALIRTENVELTLQQLQAFYDLLEIDGGNVNDTSPQEIKSNINNRTVIYKCFCPLTKKIKFLKKCKNMEVSRPGVGRRLPY